MSSLNPYKIIPVFILLFVLSNSLSLESVSDRVKRDSNVDLFYPDWLPFKNEQGDISGELKTEYKAKPKKRLAHPANYMLKPFAESESDDYYEKGQGESDSEDYYEKKEWSDTHRPVETLDMITSLNHENMSDIDGLINIIAKSNPITEVLKRQKKISELTDVLSAESAEDMIGKKVKKDDKTDSNQKRDNSMEEQKSEEKKEVKNLQIDEDELDYEDENTESKKTEISDEEKRENEAKKARILSSVDDLKERHAQEQRIISEKVKEEEMYKEELERDKIKLIDESDKYSSHPRKTVDYDNYDNKEGSKDKYKINHHKPTKSTTRKPKRITTHKPKPKKTEKHVESGKLSVFKNPRAYMVYDDDDSGEKTTETTKAPEPTRMTKRLRGRYSSKYSTPTANSEENVRISLVPEEKETKEGEPTMFFPKRRSKKRKLKSKTLAAEDSSVAESVTDKTAEHLITAFDKTFVDSTAPETASTGAGSIETEPETAPTSTGSTTFTEETAPSAEGARTFPMDAETMSVVGIVDTVPASSNHEKGHHKGENDQHLKGGHKEHHSEHESSHEEHGKKAYEGLSAVLKNISDTRKYWKPKPVSKPWYYHYAQDGIHKDTKTEKGHHDKEDHHGRYKDHGGINKHHHDEKKHYGAHHHEEHGKKHAKYEESGKHSKGHSTKGSHDIHKKEEYEKNVEFFEEDGDSSEEEKHGGHNHELRHASGGHVKKGNLNAAYNGHDKGDKGRFFKGSRGHGHNGHRSSAGDNSHAKHAREHYNKADKTAGKKWIYHHGFPAQTANLVVIDRRVDPFYHEPQYYG